MVSMGAGRVTSPGRSASSAAQAAPLARAAENRTRTRSPSRAQNPRSRVGVPASFLQDSHALAPDSSYWAAPHGDHRGRHRTLPLRDRWSRHALTRIVCCCGRAWCQGVPGAKAPASTCCCSRCRAGWRRAPPHQRRQARRVDRRNAPTLAVARRSGRACCGRATTGGESC